MAGSSRAAIHQVLAAVRTGGSGRQCLVQHPAGSGNSNSIAWAAHFLADLHDAEHCKVIHSVSVTFDRTVLDSPLREVLTAFARTQGVVAIVNGDGASNSRELTEALAADKKIIVCTLQAFPYVLEPVRQLAATEGKRFAVISDETHSSQSNQTGAKLKLLPQRCGPGQAGGLDRRWRDRHRRPAVRAD